MDGNHLFDVVLIDLESYYPSKLCSMQVPVTSTSIVGVNVSEFKNHFLFYSISNVNVCSYQKNSDFFRELLLDQLNCFTITQYFQLEP